MGIWGRNCEGQKDWEAKKKLDVVPQAHWGTVVPALHPREAEAGESVRLSGSSRFQFQNRRCYTVCASSPKQNTQKARGTGFTEMG